MGLRKLGANIGQTLGRQLLAMLFGLGTAAVIARALGPAGNGQYAVAMLLPTFLGTFLNLGISSANVYYVGRHSVTPWVAAHASMRIWLMLSLIGAVVGAILIGGFGEKLFPGVPAYLLWLALLTFPLSLLQGYLSSLLQGVQDFRRYNLSILVAPIAMFVLVFLFLGVGEGGVAAVVIAFAVVQAINLAITYYLIRPVIAAGPTDDPSDLKGYSRQAVHYGYKAHLSNILAFFNYKADIFLVNLLINPAAAGIYVIAVAMGEKLWVLSQAASTVILPRLSELHTDEITRGQLTPFIARWVLIITMFGAILLALTFVPLTSLLFGEAYLAAGKPLLVLLPGIVLGSSARIYANDVAARGRPELNMYTAIFVVVVNVIGNLLLIPYWGLVGAALATTLAYSLNFVLRLWLYSWISGNRWYSLFVLNAYDAEVVQFGKRLLVNAAN